MDTTLVYNFPNITKSDTITAVVSNFPDEFTLSDNAMGIGDSILHQINESNVKIDSVYSILQHGSAEGWGVAQVISIIAIPLIIAVFALSLPLILNAVWKMDSIYQSREVSRILDQSWQMILCLFLICINALLLLSWLLFPELQNRMVYTLPITTAGLVISVLIFYRAVRKFSNPYMIMDQLERRYRREFVLTYVKMKIRGWRLRLRRYIDQNDTSAKNVWDMMIGLNEYNVYYKPDHRYFDRLLAMLRIAIEKNDLTLYYAIKEALERRIQEIKIRSLDTAKMMPIYYKEADALFQFHRDAISLAGSSNDPTFQAGIIDSLSTIYSHSQLPVELNNIGILKSLAQLRGDNGLNVVKKYLNRVNYMYGYIRSMAIISNIVGVDLDEKRYRELLCHNHWRWLRAMHYIFCAYWWQKSGYKIASDVCPPKKRMVPTDMLPVCGADILYQCISALDNFDTRVSTYPIGEVFDISNDSMREMVISYTAFMMYYTANREKNYHAEPLDANERKCMDAVIPLINIAVDSKHIKNVLDQIQFDYTGIDIHAVIARAQNDVLYNESNNIYEQKLNDDRIREIKHQLEHCEQYIQSPIVEGLYRDDDIDYNEEILLRESTIAMAKDFYILPNHDGKLLYSITRSLGQDILNRYLYAWLTCIMQMNVSNKAWNLAHFTKNLRKYTSRNNEQYVLVSIDSPYDSFAYPHPQGIIYVQLSKHHVNLCASTKLFRENAKVAFLIRQDDLPSLRYEEGYESAECDIEDESSREKGLLNVRLNINPHLALRFTKNAKVLRIKCKKIGV